MYYICVYTGPDQGVCVWGGQCLCSADWIGDKCHIPCMNGTNNGDGVCRCEKACVSGIGCHLECSTHGQCDNNGECVCDFFEGYKGDVCDLPSCPGWPEDCMGKGTCNKATGTCECEPGYLGRHLLLTSRINNFF